MDNTPFSPDSALQAEALDLLRTLAQIPAPTGFEHKRAQFVAAWFLEAGFTDVRIDEVQNVIVRVDLGEGSNALLFSAHMDVVFDDTEALPLHEDKRRMYAPGVGDDTANLVVLMLAAREVFGPRGRPHCPRTSGCCTQLQTSPSAARVGTVYIVANTQEEGLGNLRGTRAVFDQLGEQIAAHVCFDLYAGQVISQAVGSRRWRVSVECAGGHSWQDAGATSATERLCALVETLMQNPLPSAATAPVVKTTQNVGTLSGGTTVNAIASHAEMLYEARSTSEGALAAMDARLHALATELEHMADLHVSIEPVGTRPASADTPSPALEPLRAFATQLAAKHFAHTPLDTRPASTDANIALSQGLPAICVGTISGGLLHTRQEYVEKNSLAAGLAFACELIDALTTTSSPQSSY